MGQELFAVFSEGVHKAPDGIFLGTAGTQPESQANARLIAAAPKGYELAERVIDTSSDCPASVVRLAKEFLAIAKAKGE